MQSSDTVPPQRAWPRRSAPRWEPPRASSPRCSCSRASVSRAPQRPIRSPKPSKTRPSYSWVSWAPSPSGPTSERSRDCAPPASALSSSRVSSICMRPMESVDRSWPRRWRGTRRPDHGTQLAHGSEDPGACAAHSLSTAAPPSPAGALNSIVAVRHRRGQAGQESDQRKAQQGQRRAQPGALEQNDRQ
jgi:hypothetical protein